MEGSPNAPDNAGSLILFFDPDSSSNMMEFYHAPLSRNDETITTPMMEAISSESLPEEVITPSFNLEV